MNISTTILLSHWEKDSGDAERLCADLLRIEAFEDVDPQHPLGGPDGGKDILCSKEGNSFVAAVHFPRDSITFSATTKKFTSDLEESLKHHRNGFIFLTNQQLTVSERSTLEKIAAGKRKRCLIYHLERLRVMLDSPAGYGLRLRRLGAAMSNEEQAAFFATSGQSFTEALNVQTRAIDSLARRIDRFGQEGLTLIRDTAAVVAGAVRGEHTALGAMLEAAAATSFKRALEDPKDAVSTHLSAPLLRYVHRLIQAIDPAIAGKFRETQVWLVDPTGTPTPGIESPSWDKVAGLVKVLVDDWNRDYSGLLENPGMVIPSIARFFHRLVWIHPFIDGNGRLARAILALQARELLVLLEDPVLDHGAEYYLALREADEGKFERFEHLVEIAVKHAGYLQKSE
ncbi:Fic family protein [Janthinobacterium sp. NKUCC06_STL]|uniref:Fic family protein n=1 Tax=Janthinobacterium sp. NKUCC06_STL TaxID=2842127 RepID=UPI001C5B3DA6|nr:Fic family protein [Janthinobacterium sp. NKUCC06_STL]